jgi:hypothetical protein
VLATTIKVSAAPVVVLTMALGWFHRKEGLISDIRVWGFSAAVLAAWMLHGFLLSGCAVYPVRPTCFAVSWAASLEQVDSEKLAIQAWARRPWEPDFARVMQDWSWFPEWFALAGQNRLMRLMAAGLVSGAAAVALSGASISKKQANGDLAFVAVGLAVCLVFWFSSAPDLRFGRGFILASALFGFSLAGAAWLHQKRFYSFMPQALILLMILFALFNLVRLKVESFVFVAPDAATYQLRTMQAIRLWVPRVGDQCWAHELPCTPYVNWVALAAIRWPTVWQYRHDSRLEPPANWAPMSGLVSKHTNRPSN